MRRRTTDGTLMSGTHHAGPTADAWPSRAITAALVASRSEVAPVLIALLALLGVNLAVLAFIVLVVFGRRRWVCRESGTFAGVAHAVSGDLHGIGSRPRRGYGRWVHDVLVWTPAPLFVSRLAPIDGV